MRATAGCNWSCSRDRGATVCRSAAQKLLDDKLAAFQLGDRDHDKKWPVEEYRAYRLQLAEAIEQLAR